MFHQHQYAAAAAVPHDHHQHSCGDEGTPFCYICHSQRVGSAGQACSRRCGWVADSSCPQCGRWNNPNAGQTFCSAMCSSGARQANWCLGCGVRQLMHGMPSCGAPRCAAAAAQPFRAPLTSGTSRRNANRNQDHPGANNATAAVAGRRKSEPHIVLPPSDNLTGLVRQQLGADSAKRLAATVKLGGRSEDRKAYTAYRGRVESDLNDISGIGAPKFGFGGEGNEHRRYVPLTAECGARPWNEPASAAANGAPVRTCGSARCQACQVLEHGVAAAFGSRHSIPCASTAAKAAELAEALRPATNRFAAVLVVRTTVGNPSVRSESNAEHTRSSSASSSAAAAAAALTAASATAILREPQPGPSIAAGEHCVVEQHAAGNFDVAHMPSSLPCVDVLFLAYLEGGAAPTKAKLPQATSSGVGAAASRKAHHAGATTPRGAAARNIAADDFTAAKAVDLSYRAADRGTPATARRATAADESDCSRHQRRAAFGTRGTATLGAAPHTARR